MSSIENANSEAHYKLLVLGVAIGLFGCFFRFAGEYSFIYTWVPNIAMVVGTIISIKAVFGMLK